MAVMIGPPISKGIKWPTSSKGSIVNKSSTNQALPMPNPTND